MPRCGSRRSVARIPGRPRPGRITVPGSGLHSGPMSFRATRSQEPRTPGQAVRPAGRNIRKEKPMQAARTLLSESGRGPVAAAVLFALTASLSSEARADITIEQRMSVNGAIRLANMTGTTTTTISGDRSHTQSDLRMDNALMRTLARGAGQSIEIVSLGEDKIWSLDPGKKTYTETTLAAQRAALQKNIESMRQAQESQQQGASGVDESSCEWLPPTSDVKRTGERQSIAGYQAEQIVVTGTQGCR